MHTARRLWVVPVLFLSYYGTMYSETGCRCLALIRQLESKLAEYEKPLVPLPKEDI